VTRVWDVLRDAVQCQPVGAMCDSMYGQPAVMPRKGQPTASCLTARRGRQGVGSRQQQVDARQQRAEGRSLEDALAWLSVTGVTDVSVCLSVVALARLRRQV
jgi:hypothetical protein